jgi:hypothetical protein
MESPVLLLSCLFCSLMIVSGQNCIEPVIADVALVADETLDIIASNNEDITIFNFTTSCLSVGTIRDRYRFATVVMYFTTPSQLFQSNGCLPNTVCLSYLEMSCSSRSNTWVFNDVFFFDSFTIDGNTTLFLDSNLPPRTDCGSCGYRESIPFVAVFDPLTHCFGCNAVCKNKGLDFCTGVTTTTCCNFYLDNTCVNDCDGNNRIANLGTNFSCICNNSFTGSNCDVCPLTCDGINSEFCFCVCPPGFTGDNCHINIDDCAGVDCNNGTCADKIESFACNCFEDYQGTFCTETINQCNSSTCLNGGTCIDGNGTFVCNCLMGYTSTNCEQLVDNCINSSCINGQCMNSLNNFTCDCDDNFSGRFCEICNLTNCNNCSNNYVDICDECEMPYYNDNGTCGLICDVLSPCLNGGTCIPTNIGYNCSCPLDYTGTNCSINLCDSITCMNGGTCKQGICSCPSGYVGLDCSVDLCDDVTCMNGGTCVQGICQCMSSFNGTQCENCRLDNCVNCIFSSNKVTCVLCDDGFVLTDGVCSISLKSNNAGAVVGIVVAIIIVIIAVIIAVIVAIMIMKKFF